MQIRFSPGIDIVARMWRLYKTGIGLTTGFNGSHTVTHNYSVCTLQLTTNYSHSAGLLTDWRSAQISKTNWHLQLTYIAWPAYWWVTWCLPRTRPPYCLRHPRNTSCGVYCPVPLRACPWRCSCKQMPYCLQHARHTIMYLRIYFKIIFIINHKNWKWILRLQW
jgi:hypothetical protein